MNARELALRMLMQITEEKKLCHTVIAQELSAVKEMDKKERAFASLLCRGVIERKITLDFLINQYSKVKTEKMKPVIRNILRMGYYQLAYTAVLPSAVCNEAVKLTKKKGFSGLSGFVNGVLRSYLRTPKMPEDFLGDATDTLRLSIRYAMPEWLTDCFLKWYGTEKTEKMFCAFLEKPALTVRINKSKTNAEACKESLRVDGIETAEGVFLADALRLSGVDSLERVAAFQNGFLQVQDESSMLPALCAGIKAGDYVIDCCAAPGGKTLQIADILKTASKHPQAKTNGFVSARDVSDYKLNKIRQNLLRCGFENVELRKQDARELCEEDLSKADVVLADLPCSGLGILGKKPDIKYNVSPEGLKQLVQLQREILKTVTSYVKPGGVLIFSTCTVNPEENIENVQWMEKELGLKPESLEPYLPPVLYQESTAGGYLQLLPEKEKTDGFFVSRFRKPVI